MKRLIVSVSFLLFSFFLLFGQTTNVLQSVTLAWDQIPDATISGFNLYYGPSSGAYTNWVSVGNVTTGVITGLVEGATYFFAATSFDTNGLESDYSNEISYTPVSMYLLTNNDLWISDISNRVVAINTSISIPVILTNKTEIPNNIKFTSGYSTNKLLLNNTNITMIGSDTNRFINIVPNINVIGITKITISILDTNTSLYRSRDFILTIVKKPSITIDLRILKITTP